MSCNPSKTLIWLALVTLVVTGCSPSKPMFLNDSGDLSHYIDQATKVEYPDVEHASLNEVTMAQAPITVLDPDFNSFEDLSLEDAVSYALSNTKVIRGYGTPSLQSFRVAPGQDSLANGPAVAGTNFDVAIRQTEPGFIGTPGQISSPSTILTNTSVDVNQGVESALADFDAQLTSSFTYTKSDEPRNSNLNLLNAQVFQQDQVQWQSEIAKKSANGTQIFFRNINQYTSNNNPLIVDGGLQALDSFYRASFEAEVRQPLLRGRGAFINRMPIVISRLSTDQEIANLEATLQNKVTNVEIRYWDLYCAYRSLDAAKTGFNASLETWRIVKNQYDEGAEVNIQQLAQAEEQYNFFESQVTQQLANLLDAEGQLRYLMGWSSTDRRLLRPIDEPVLAPIEFDWCTSLCEALTYRPELRQERIEIKKRELALAYSKNGLLPEFNITMLYRFLGLGNKFGTSSTSVPFPSDDSGALNELYGGDFQELQFGGTFGLPVGFRRELANVRNAQLKLARELARVEDMELDITKNLSEAMRALATNQRLMVSFFNRWKATTIEERHFERLQDAGVETLDVALDAQRRRSDSEIAFHQAVCEYNKLIALIHRRKGTILPYSGVHFAEGPWPGKAYVDAQEHARRRGASTPLNYGWSRPQVISRGENQPTANNTGNSPTAMASPATNFLLEQPVNTGITPLVAPDMYNPVQGGVMLDSYEGTPIQNVPSEMQLDGTPIYNNVPLVPTPALDGASNNRVQQPAIQQASFEEAVEAPVASRTATGRSSSRSTRRSASQSNHVPVAVLKEKNRRKPAAPVSRTVGSVSPVRDMTPRPINRLNAPPRVVNPQNGVVQTTRPSVSPGTQVSNVKPKAVLRSGNLSWEKFGMSRPDTQPTRTTARIKTN